MSTRVPLLLVSTATRWFGTARSPRALSHAGFDVSLLVPRGALAEKSGYLSRIGYLPDNASTRDWLDALAAMVKAVDPRLVVPCDDMSFRLLATLVTDAADAMPQAWRERLAALARFSLGDPAHYLASVDKTLLAPAARAMGVRVPDHVVATDVGTALAFGRAQGYPVVVKRGYGTAGDAVSICADAGELAAAATTLLRADPADLDGSANGRVLVQSHVDGPICFYQVTAWAGELVAGWLAERVVGNPEPKGPATVVRLRRDAAMHEASAHLVRALGMSGTASIEFVVDRASGSPFLLEINRRVSPGWHLGALVGCDQCAALHAALSNTARPPATLATDEATTLAHFPQEWLRDPGSVYLQGRVDVPWDEPELMEAMLALRDH